MYAINLVGKFATRIGRAGNIIHENEVGDDSWIGSKILINNVCEDKINMTIIEHKKLKYLQFHLRCPSPAFNDNMWIPWEDWQLYRNRKFQPGDKVKVVKKINKIGYPCWVPNMDNMLGKTYTVLKNSGNKSAHRFGLKYDYIFLVEPNTYGISSESLELVEPVVPIKGLKYMENIEKEKSEKELRDAYIVMQKASGIEVGDKVRILRKAKDYEMGWTTCWVEHMDKYVGKTGIVTIVNDLGIEVRIKNVNICDIDFNWKYPFFVLEIVEKATKYTFPLIFDDIPSNVLIAIRNKYQKIFDNGPKNYDRINDWNTKTCPMCQYIKENFYEIVKPSNTYEDMNANKCADICPLAKDRWCKGHGGRLYLSPSNETAWTNNVAEFICMLNRHLANRANC